MPLLHSIPTPYFGIFLHLPDGRTAEDEPGCVSIQIECQVFSLDVILLGKCQHIWCSLSLLRTRSWHYHVSQKRTSITLKNYVSTKA